MYMINCTRVVFFIILGNGSKASTSRKAEVEVIEETASEAGSYQEDPDWLATINQKFATTTPPPSESSNTNSEQEVNVRQTYVKSQKKSLTGVKNGGVKKAKATSKKQIERWDFFNPVAAFTQGVQSDVRKPGEVQKITQYRKLIGNTRSVSFQYHTYEDRNGDLKKYPAIMFVNSYTIARDQLKDPINDDVSF